MTITNYRAISTAEPKQLEEQVEKFIAHGWQPFGSPVVLPSLEGSPRVIQVVVKYADAEGDGS